MNRWVAYLPLVVLIGAAVLFAGWSLGRKSHVEPDALVGQKLPQITLTDLHDGAAMTLPSTVQGVTFVNTFASWCAPCRLEHPNLEMLKERGARIVGVAYKDTPQATKGFLNELGDPYAVVLSDPDRLAGVPLGITGVPETYLVAPDGVILAKHTGPLSREDAERLWKQAQALR